MNTIRTYLALLAFAVTAVLIVAACGGGDSGTGASASNGSETARTISVTSVDGVGDVLVDEQGSALYAADQEMGGMVVCTDSCTSIWEPLTVSDGVAPTADDGLAAKLDTVERPDGARQVTFGGRLLYRFLEDPAPETVTGNGFPDSFDGQAFTWHVVTPTGVSTSSANSASSDGLYD
jgi:predicted lipoprotein with Yx(FWY)xxD motif